MCEDPGFHGTRLAAVAIAVSSTAPNSRCAANPAPSCTSTAILADGPFATLQSGVLPFTVLLHADEHVVSWVMLSCAAPASCEMCEAETSSECAGGAILADGPKATRCVTTAVLRCIGRQRSAPLCFVPACRGAKLYRGQFLNRSWRCSSAVQLLVWAIQLCHESE